MGKERAVRRMRLAFGFVFLIEIKIIRETKIYEIKFSLSRDPSLSLSRGIPSKGSCPFDRRAPLLDVLLLFVPLFPSYTFRSLASPRGEFVTIP